MFSTLTSRGAATTIEALSLGASDYLTKPAGATSLMESMERLRQDLVPKVRALVRVREERGQDQPARGDLRSNMTAPSTSGPAQVGPPPLQRAGTSAQLMQHRERYPERRPFQPSGRHLMRPAELVVVGVSTGGPNALARFIPALPGNLPVPVLIVQHMPPLFTRMLADRLDQNSQLKVREAEAGAVLRPGEAWVAKGDWHMEVARESGQLLLKEHQGPQVNSCRPAVDTLFQSAAQACPATAVAVVLTGMGRDGLRGARAIREGGGLVLAQDEESSVVWGMPGAVSNAGVADQVLPLDQLAPHLLQSLRRDRSTTTGAGPWR
jgi:two-component system chemotaxis response regulator CheB